MPISHLPPSYENNPPSGVGLRGLGEFLKLHLEAETLKFTDVVAEGMSFVEFIQIGRAEFSVGHLISADSQSPICGLTESDKMKYAASRMLCPPATAARFFPRRAAIRPN